MAIKPGSLSLCTIFYERNQGERITKYVHSSESIRYDLPYRYNHFAGLINYNVFFSSTKANHLAMPDLSVTRTDRNAGMPITD
jgi:hypothetical protein